MSTTPPTATIPVASTSSRTTRGRIPAPSHHSRSYSASTNMNLGLSSSPTSTSSTSSIATPPSTSPTTIFASYYGIPVKGGGGKDEEDETEDVFARGDRWGWPQPSQAQNHQRRASLGPSGTGLIGLPLGRVASAGASFGGPSPPAAGDGWGLFRRLSHGGFSGRPKPPSPPASSLGISTSRSTATPATVLPATVIVEEPKTIRGRRASVGAKEPKAKRKISPMGERMLRGGGWDH